jgi:hypothetical protein
VTRKTLDLDGGGAERGLELNHIPLCLPSMNGPDADAERRGLAEQ